ncbi:MAG: iron transporter [Arcobacter sp.]|nr:iron transporter [Arcobacter sp.]
MKKILLATAALLTFANAEFKEFPIGEGKTINNMEIAAVYLKPIDMEPRGIDRPASLSDIHLEADIHAAKGNKNGFGAGEWIPYLTISYVVTNKDTGKSVSGTFMPMVAVDGPHYGANIKMPGIGNYTFKYSIEPPSKQGFGRHTDKDSGVGKWFKPFSVKFEGKYKGIK